MRTRSNLLVFIIPFILMSCENNINKKEIKDSSQVELIEKGPIISPNILPKKILDGATPPFDLEKNASILENALFAWKEMIALSWQSNYRDTIGDINIIRGQPDLSWTYAKGTPKHPLVWETFAHRIEYRPKGDTITKDFNSKPSYPFVNKNEVDWNGINPSDHFIVLDEDNEIGSCYVFSKPNINTITTDNKLVMYMAKVNEVEYNYRKKYFNSADKIKQSISIISDTTDHKGVKLLKKISTHNGDQTDPCGAKHFANNNNVIVFPCSDSSTKQKGVIEIKTAWRPLLMTDKKEEFLVREAIVFDEKKDSSKTKYIAQKVPYVLIGMHIIHKTKNYRNFFIASWEHNSLQSYGYKFVLNDPASSPDTKEGYKILPVERHNDTDGAHSYIKEVYKSISDTIQAEIKKANPNNFLANYRLIGFQSDLYPDAELKDRKKQMPAYYLANLVIESDATLSDFSGNSISNPFNNKANVVVDKKLITAGGCVGCHGVAQQSGSDFSFLNDFAGKPIPNPEPRSLSQKKINSILYPIIKNESK